MLIKKSQREKYILRSTVGIKNVNKDLVNL